MRILQVFNFFSLPHGGGTVAVIYQLSRALMQRGHEVAIYTSDFELDQDYINSLQGISVHPFHCWLNLSGLYIIPDMVKEAKRKLKDFDIIHLHCHRSFQNIMIHRYAKKYGVPYILQAHGSTLRTLGKRRLKWLFDVAFGYRILRDASRVITDSKVGINEYKEAGVNPDKILLIPLAHDNEKFSQLPPPGIFRRKYNIKEKHIILFLGRVHWIKGLDFLIESFYELTHDRKDVILVIVGSDDGYKSTLERLIEKLNLSDKVLFTGFVDEEDKISALVDATVLVQPSVYEHAAWASFEAILCNTPIIVSKNTGAGDDVSKIDAGYLVEYGNRKELKDTIQKVLDNSAEATSKTQRAKHWIITNLSMGKQIEEYEKLYKEVIADFHERKAKNKKRKIL